MSFLLNNPTNTAEKPYKPPQMVALFITYKVPETLDSHLIRALVCCLSSLMYSSSGEL